MGIEQQFRHSRSEHYASLKQVWWLETWSLVKTDPVLERGYKTRKLGYNREKKILEDILMTAKSYRSGLIWLSLLIGLPMLLLATLSLGGYPSNKLMPLTTGIFAYIWMLGALFLAGKPRMIDQTTASLAQVAILPAALPFAVSHATLNPATGWTGLSGGLALVALIAVACYHLTYILASRLTNVQTPRRLLTWVSRLNALATGLTFIHVQLIADIRSNLPFMLAFYALTGLAFASFLGKKAGAAEEETAGQTETV